ncbi:MAG: hypothetical protein EOO47_16415, partial [Flavobacterium sp.]
LLCLLNFSPTKQNIKLDVNGSWICIINSNSNKYNSISEVKSQHQILEKQILIEPKSALIFEYASF